MAAGWLVPGLVWGWLPNGKEWLALCQQKQWEQNAQPLLAEPDEEIRRWLKRPIDDRGNTPLHTCAREGHPGLLLQLLLRAGPEECQPLMAIVDNYGNTPLHLAANHGRLEVAQCLLAHGASAAAVNEDGDTPLHWAADSGHLQVVQCLLAHGASVAAVNGYDNTPLHWAAHNGHLEVAQCLLAHGASTAAVNRYSNTPLQMAACNSYQDVVALLGSPPTPDLTPPDLQYLSCFAVWQSAGHIEKLQQWLQASPLPPLQTAVLLSTLGFSQWLGSFKGH